jgi:hypothetical protein
MYYGWQFVALGERPAPCTFEIWKDLAADNSEALNPEAARTIKEGHDGRLSLYKRGCLPQLQWHPLRYKQKGRV